jgi:hypothetical protein
MVSIGIMAFGKMCPTIVCQEERPLARAVVTYGSRALATIADRKTENKIAACGNASAIAGNISAHYLKRETSLIVISCKKARLFFNCQPGFVYEFLSCARYR